MSLFESESSVSGSPWGPLRDPLLYGLDEVQDIYGRGTWGGPYTAGIDPNQTAGIASGIANAGGAGSVGDAYRTAGTGMIPGLGSAFNYFNSSLGGSQNPWMTNQDQYMDFAASIADSPYLNSQITAALRDPYRGLTEGALPGNAMNAVMMGQSGGSGREVGDAIARRGYEDRATDIGGQMRGNAYQTGLNFANQAATGDQKAAWDSALQLSGLGAQGLGYLGEGYGWDQTGATDQYNWGTTTQNLENEQLDANMREFYEPWKMIENYGNYVNPLTENLFTRTSEQDQLMPWLFGSEGPLSEIGGKLGDEFGEYIKGFGDDNKWFG